MPQPTPFVRGFDFTDFSQDFPSSQQPGTQIDAEFDAVKETLDGVLTNLEIIQRDDGELANASVRLVTLHNEVIAALTAIGAEISTWETGTDYDIGNIVIDGDNVYLVAVAHTSGVLATDLAADQLVRIFDSGMQATIDALTAGVFLTDQYDSFADAVTAWAAAGGTLLVNADHTVTSSITATLQPNTAYQIRALGKRVITYAGPEAAYMIRIDGAAGAPLDVDGGIPYVGITFDGANLVNRPFAINYDSVSGADRDGVYIKVWGIWSKDAKMVVVNGDANGIKFGGGCESVDIAFNRVGPVGREAGLGTPGSQGSVGIQLFGSGTANMKRVTVRHNIVDTVTTDDTPGTADYTDMDGILIFQNDEEGVAAPVIEYNFLNECAGRAVKVFAEVGGAIVRGNHDFVSVEGVPTGSIRYDVQAGDGTVQGNTTRLRGDANAAAVATIPISMGVSAVHAAGFPYYSAIISGNLVDDDTGITKPACVSFVEGTGNPTGRHCVLENHRDSGVSKQMFKLLGMGNSLLSQVRVDNVDCNITLAATITDDTLSFLRVYMTRINNRAGSNKPIGMFLDEVTPRSTNLGIWEIEHPVVGFAPIGKAVYDTGGLQVVGARGAALPADATDLASVITLANAIKARLKATGGHGLVAD